jgi:hypothetical protein
MWRDLYIPRTIDLETSVLFITQWRQAPVYSFTKRKMEALHQNCSSFQMAKNQGRETYSIRRTVHAKHLGARPVADAPDEDVLHPRCHLLLGNVALDDRDGVRLPPIFIGRVYPVLHRLQHRRLKLIATAPPARPSIFSLSTSSSSGRCSSVSRDVS